MKHYTSPRIQRAQLFLMKVSSYLEIVCALILIVAILIAFVPVPHNLYSLYLDNGCLLYTSIFYYKYVTLLFVCIVQEDGKQ